MKLLFLSAHWNCRITAGVLIVCDLSHDGQCAYLAPTGCILVHQRLSNRGWNSADHLQACVIHVTERVVCWLTLDDTYVDFQPRNDLSLLNFLAHEGLGESLNQVWDTCVHALHSDLMILDSISLTAFEQLIVCLISEDIPQTVKMRLHGLSLLLSIAWLLICSLLALMVVEHLPLGLVTRWHIFSHWLVILNR